MRVPKVIHDRRVITRDLIFRLAQVEGECENVRRAPWDGPANGGSCFPTKGGLHGMDARRTRGGGVGTREPVDTGVGFAATEFLEAPEAVEHDLRAGVHRVPGGAAPCRSRGPALA